MLFLLLLLTSPVWAQITDASFFPSVKSINPGIVRLRNGGFLAADSGNKNIEKNHDVPLGGIVGGIKTEVELKKQTFFAGAGYKYIGAEVLMDKESGTRKETINSTTQGKRTISDETNSNYQGVMLDLWLVGISYATADFDYLNEFRVGTPPTLTARDEKKDLTYTTVKTGSAFKILNLRFGGYILDQQAKGDYTYTYYDPTTGNQGTSEAFKAKNSARGYGYGIGATFAKFRAEISTERMYDTKLKISSDYPGAITQPKPSSRLSAVAEARVFFAAIGIRFRSIKGNFTDLEDLISSNILYDKIGANDTRTETSFNLSLGDKKGFSPSAFYTTSTVTSQELSPVFDNGLKYKAVTKSKAFGFNISYRF